MLNQIEQEVGQYIESVSDIYPHDRLMRTYTREKQHFLFKLFGESLIHSAPVSYSKSLSEIAIEIESHESFKKILLNSLDDKFLLLLKNVDYTIPLKEQEGFGETMLRRKIQNPVFLSSKLLLEDFYMKMTDGTEIKANKGSKVSKLFGQLISDKPALDKVQTMYSQFFNSAKISGTLCLSIHPLDYLTVSDNKSGWSSCFSTLRRGEYQASTLSLLSSKNTFVAYIKSNVDVQYVEVGMTWNSKKWRVLVTLSDDLKVCHIGMEYPYTLDNQFKLTLLKEISKLTGMDYTHQWENGHPRVKILAPSTFYNDADRSKNGNIYIAHTDDSNLKEEKGATEYLRITHSLPVCIKCGNAHEGEGDSLVCPKCYYEDNQCCESCGDLVSQDIVQITDDSYTVCQYCFERYTETCERCENTVLHYRTIKEEFICPDCL